MSITYNGVLGTAGGTSGTGIVTVGTGGSISSAAAGDTVVLAVGGGSNNRTVTSATDTHGNSYSILGQIFGTGGSFTSIALVASKLTTGLSSGDTIAVTFSASDQWSIIAADFSGVSTTQNGGIQTNTSSTYFGTQWDTATTHGGTGPLVTTNASNLLLQGGANDANTTDTPAASWTDIPANGYYNATSTVQTFLQYRIVSSTGSYTGGGTLGGNTSTSVLITALEAAGGSSPIPFVAPAVSTAVNRSLFY